jgi:hypothetical protein
VKLDEDVRRLWLGIEFEEVRRGLVLFSSYDKVSDGRIHG